MDLTDMTDRLFGFLGSLPPNVRVKALKLTEFDFFQIYQFFKRHDNAVACTPFQRWLRTNRHYFTDIPLKLMTEAHRA